MFNIGLEGIMLSAALAGAMGSYYLGGPWAGLLLAVVVGAAMGAVLAFLSVTMSTNQVVAGVAVNLLAFGITTFVARLFLRGVEAVPSFHPIAIPVLAELPIVGRAIFNQTVFVYMLLILTTGLTIFLFRTPWGLVLRAAGEHPVAVEAAGVNVALVRYVAVSASGLIAAIGGCYLSIAHLNLFTENMSAGRGFIALAAIIFGKWHPIGALGAALLFGTADALQLIIQTYNLSIPYQLPVMMPYVLALLALSGLAGRASSPAALGLPYRVEEN